MAQLLLQMLLGLCQNYVAGLAGHGLVGTELFGDTLLCISFSEQQTLK